MNSLETRLQLGLVASLVVLVGLLLWGGAKALNALAESFVAERLEHDAGALLGAVRPGRARGSGPGMRAQRVTPVYQQPFSGHYYVVRYADGETIRSRSLWDQTLDLPNQEPGAKELLLLPGPENQELLVWIGGFRKQGHRLTLAVAEDIAPLRAQIVRYQLWLAMSALAATVLLLVLQRLVVRKTLQRLDRVREELRLVGSGQAASLGESVPEEILPLVREINRLLGLLGARMQRSRNALGNLAHAIKGPLNLLIQGLDQEHSAPPEMRRDLVAQAERIRYLTQRELRRARLAGSGAPGQRFDPEADVPPLIGALQQMYLDKRLDIQCTTVPQRALEIDREDLLELLGNLLDNACKWARSRVRSRLEEEAGVLQVVIEDDGPGVSASQLTRLTKRGVRIDESTEGHGLGLSIAQDVAHLYGGALQFSASPDFGGLQVIARLRLTSVHPGA